jgi:hypothetical protein
LVSKLDVVQPPTANASSKAAPTRQKERNGLGNAACNGVARNSIEPSAAQNLRPENSYPNRHYQSIYVYIPRRCGVGAALRDRNATPAEEQPWKGPTSAKLQKHPRLIFINSNVSIYR